MREIKFRGCDGMDWVYGSAVQYDKETDTWYMIENGAPDDDWVMVGNVGQYTGLKDKNGKEIYEGDILKNNQFWEVQYASTLARFMMFSYDLKKGEAEEHNMSFLALMDFEIVGNIYEKSQS